MAILEHFIHELYKNRIEKGDFMKNSHLDRRTKYSLQVIRSALFELLETKELKNITVTDICRQADINRGTFYRYYDDVLDLFHRIELSIVDEACEIINQNCLEHFSVEKLISGSVNILTKNSDFTRMLAKNPVETLFLQGIISSFRPQLIETMLANIPDLAEEMSDLYFDFILGGTVNILLGWIKKDMVIPAEQMKTVSIQFINSVLNMKVLPQTARYPRRHNKNEMKNT